MSNEVRTGYAANQAYSDSFLEPDLKAVIAEYNRKIDVIQMAVSKIRQNIPKSLPKFKQLAKIQPTCVEKIIWPIAKVGTTFLYLTEDWKFVFYASVMVTVGDNEKERVKQYFELNLSKVNNSFSEVINGYRPVTEKFMIDAAQGAVDFFCSTEITRLFNIEREHSWIPYIEGRPSVIVSFEEQKQTRKNSQKKELKGHGLSAVKLLSISFVILAAVYFILNLLN